MSAATSTSRIDSSTLWLRKWKLSIGNQSGTKALDLSPLAFEFAVDMAFFLHPSAAQITIYNVTDDVITAMQKELTMVYLEAGYQPPSTQYGKIFGGPIVFYKHGRRNATDTYVEIHAAMYEQAINKAVVNTWLPAGHTKEDVVKACISAMQKMDPGMTQGQITDLGDEKSPRGRVLFGQASDALRDVANTAGANVYVDLDGHLHIKKENESLDTTTVPVLNSRSGMVDVPTATLGGGIEVRSLLNFSIVPGGKVQVNQKDIVQYNVVDAFPLGNQAMGYRQAQEGVQSKGDGIYTVISVKHWGQNRGNPWYSDVTTYPAVPPAGAVGVRTSF